MQFLYSKFLEIVEAKMGKRPTHKEIARIIVEKLKNDGDINKIANNLSNRLYNKAFLSCEEFVVLKNHYEKVYGSLFSAIPEDVTNDIFIIEYWEGADKCFQDLKNSFMRPKVADKQVVKSLWGINYEGLRIIAMPGDKMTGGMQPIMDKDVLLLDLEQSNPANSGIYLYTTQGEKAKKKNAGVARLSYTLEGNGINFVFDNPAKEPRTLTFEQLEKLNFKVVGRILLNYSRQLN